MVCAQMGQPESGLLAFTACLNSVNKASRLTVNTKRHSFLFPRRSQAGDSDAVED
jgi:hypothetical protein